jgi:16S rRNA (uracil1498-N3)-methyltransferase
MELGCRVESVRDGRVSLRVEQRIQHERSPHRITLIQSMVKGRAMEWILQKATELGVARIVPVCTERTVLRLESAEGAGRREKWRTIAVEAIKQCGSPWLPEIEVPMPIAAHLKKGERAELEMAGSLQSEVRHPRQYFDAFVAENRRLPRSVALWIGPEGDFTPEELGGMIERGVRPVTFGRQVLRSDTAAVYAISVVQYELGWTKVES